MGSQKRICKACNNELQSGVSVCPVCGTPYIINEDGSGGFFRPGDLPVDMNQGKRQTHPQSGEWSKGQNSCYVPLNDIDRNPKSTETSKRKLFIMIGGGVILASVLVLLVFLFQRKNDSDEDINQRETSGYESKSVSGNQKESGAKSSQDTMGTTEFDGQEEKTGSKELESVKTLYSKKQYYDCWKKAKSILGKMDKTNPEYAEIKKLEETCYGDAKPYYLAKACDSLLNNNSKKYDKNMGYLEGMYKDDKTMWAEITSFRTEYERTEEENAFVDQLLKWSEDSVKSGSGTDYWGIEEDLGMWVYYRSFAIGDFDTDGRKELAVWKQVYEGEFLHSDTTDSKLYIYEYKNKKVDVGKTLDVDSEPDKLSYFKDKNPKFYQGKDEGLKNYYDEHYRKVDSRLKKQLNTVRRTFDDDRKLYKELLDDIYDAYQRNDSYEDYNGTYPHYSETLYQKWGGGHYGEWYQFIDLDNNGTDELVVFDDGVAAIYTVKAGKPVLLMESATNNCALESDFYSETYILWSGHIVTRYFSSQTGEGGFAQIYFDDGAIKVESGYAIENPYFYKLTGYSDGHYVADRDHPISEEEAMEIENMTYTETYVAISCNIKTYEK